MRIQGLIAAILVAGCQQTPERNAAGPAAAAEPANGAEANDAAPATAPAPGAAAPSSTAGGWDLQASGEGSALVLSAPGGATAIRLYCPAAGKTLLVNVPAFKPIGSEERLSFGSGGTVVALVADTKGDRLRGGVSGTGALPAELAAIVGGPVSASYGAQTSGPHAAPPAALAQAFVGACRGKAPANPPPAPLVPPEPEPGAAASGPCMTQGKEKLAVKPLRAVGTEPFWGARIEGRCVTYSHPDDQKGTRVWTRYTPGAGGGGTWSGNLRGKPFELRARPQAGCSDGMSDRRYPMAVDLVVGGEKRSGCAEPA
jgi:uncharacterized membrane protein